MLYPATVAVRPGQELPTWSLHRRKRPACVSGVVARLGLARRQQRTEYSLDKREEPLPALAAGDKDVVEVFLLHARLFQLVRIPLLIE